MSDAYFSNVSSLLHFDGADASTTFTDVKGKVWTAAGNAQLDTAQSKFGGASGLFDGTTDYISTPSVADFDFGSGDFTVEFWIRPNSVTGFQNLIGKRLVIDWAPFTMALDGDKLRSRLSTTGSSWAMDQTGTIAIATGAWTHVALTRSGTTFRQFVNGVLDGSATFSGALMTNSSAVYVGAQSDGAAAYNGWIDDLRITKGVARYTDNFAPPALAHPDAQLPATDGYFSNVSSLLHFDGVDASTSFTDVKGKVWTAAGNAQIDTAQSKFGGASGLFDGAGDYLSTPANADFYFGSSDFTIEGWVRTNGAVGATACFVGQWSIGNLQFIVGCASTNRAYFSLSTNGTTGTELTGANNSVPTSTWAHFAAVRHGSMHYYYINGVLVASGAITGALYNSTANITVGSNSVPQAFNGWIDDVRITKGVCRYPSGTTFTPPGLAFPDTSGEVPSTVGVVSLMHFDGPNGSTVFSDVMGKEWTVFGNAQISSAQAKFGATSFLLDGTGDAIASASPDFGFGAGNWTWEAWVRPTDATGNECVFDNRIGGAEGIGIYSSLSLHTNKWGISNNSAVVATGTNLTAGVWTHLAVSKQGTTIVGFKNGVVDFTYTDTRTYASSAIALIGAAADPATQNFNGYIDEMRITKGEARYVAGFSVATAAFVDPIDPLWSSTATLLHFNGTDASTTFTDETGKIWSVLGNAQIDTAQSKFGNASGLFDGTGDALESSTTGLIDLSGNFTIEYWVRQSAAGGTVNTHLHLFDAGGFNGGLSIYRTVATGFLGVDNGLTSTTAGTIAIPLNTWTHIAIVRDGGNIRAYINGVQCMNNPVQTYPAINTIRVGLFKGALYSLTGHIDELRITNGICRYPGGTTFTPSPEPFPGGFLDTTIDPLEPLDYADVVLADSPMAYYRLGESSGTVANDSSGNGRHGTYSATGITLGTPSLLTGSGNNAVTFDPASDTSQVDCGFNADLYWGCTLEAIVKIDAAQPDDQPTIIGKRQYFASTFADFPISLHYKTADGKLYFNLDSGIGNYVTDLELSAAITTGVAHHVIGVYRPNGQCGLWIDGIEVAAGTFTGTIAGNARNWLIGASHPNAGGVGQHRFKGVIDEAAIYSSPLSDARIAEHYAAYAGLPSPGGTIGGGGGGSTPVTRSYGFVA